MPMMNKNPYDSWERFKLPWYKRIFLVFLGKKERQDVQERIDKINRLRRIERAENIKKMKQRLRPKPQQYRRSPRG